MYYALFFLGTSKYWKILWQLELESTCLNYKELHNFFLEDLCPKCKCRRRGSNLQKKVQIIVILTETFHRLIFKTPHHFKFCFHPVLQKSIIHQ